MKTKIYLALILLSIVGCAHQPIWENAGKSRQDYAKDLTKCRTAAGQATPDGPGQRAFDFNSDRDYYFMDCMKAEGYKDINN